MMLGQKTLFYYYFCKYESEFSMHHISWEHEREIFRLSLHFKVCGGQLLLIDTTNEETKCLSVSYDASGL